MQLSQVVFSWWIDNEVIWNRKKSASRHTQANLQLFNLGSLSRLDADYIFVYCVIAQLNIDKRELYC